MQCHLQLYYGNSCTGIENKQTAACSEVPVRPVASLLPSHPCPVYNTSPWSVAHGGAEAGGTGSCPRPQPQGPAGTGTRCACPRPLLRCRSHSRLRPSFSSHVPRSQTRICVMEIHSTSISRCLNQVSNHMYYYSLNREGAWRWAGLNKYLDKAGVF